MRLDRHTADLGEDVRIRPVTDEDVPALFRLVDAHRDHLRAWMPWLDGTRQEEDVRAWAETERAKAAEGKAVQFVILEEEAHGGVIGFNDVDWEHLQAEMGYWLAADRQGRGLVTRAAAELVRWAFDELGLNRVEIRVASGNERSRAVPERLRFRHEGTQREAERLYDRFVDLEMYGLLAGDRREPRVTGESG
jgi:ribosomal-protein-serine acetyltransferase